MTLRRWQLMHALGFNGWPGSEELGVGSWGSAGLPEAVEGRSRRLGAPLLLVDGVGETEEDGAESMEERGAHGPDCRKGVGLQAGETEQRVAT